MLYLHLIPLVITATIFVATCISVGRAGDVSATRSA
jgi:hypothetical protein